jgi:elongation factor 1-beta
MAKVLIVFRILPKNAEVNLDKIRERIINSISPEKIEKEPIAFGLTALKISKLVEDKEGEIEKVENELKKIEEISQIDVIEVTKCL